MRSVLAVFAGFLVLCLFSFGTDAGLRALLPGSYGPDGQVTSTHTLLLCALAAVLSTVAGGYAAGRLAPSRPARHALTLGVAALAFGVAVSFAMWSTAPLWYHVLGWVLAVPSALAGGRLAERARRSARLRA